MSAAGIRAGRAYVEFGVDNNPLSAGLRAAQARLKQFGSSLTAIGSGLMGISAAAAAPLALATTQFASFESAMARVQALTNANATDFAALSAEAKRLGATTVFTAAQAGQAMGVFALAGYQTADILKATGPALDLAAAGQMDLAQAADISMKVMSGMGIATENLGGAIDVLAKAMTTANTDLVMLGEAFKYVGPVARSAGMSLEETTAAIQILSDAGIQADMAGTTLRGAILSLTSPSEEAKRALQQMGIQVNDAQGNFRGLTAIIGDMQKALAGMGSGQRLQLIGDVFANRQATGISVLIDRGVAELRQKTAALGTAAQEGVAGRIAGIQLNTLYGGFMLLISAAEGLAVAIGSALNPTLRKWGEIAIGIIDATRQIVEANKDWIPVIATTVLAIGAVGAGLVVVGTSFQLLAFSAGGLATAFGLLFSPTGWVLAGVAAFATLTDAGKSMVSGIGESLKGIGETFSTAWTGIMDAMKAGSLETAGRIAWSGFQTVWAQGVKELYTSWSGFSGFFVDTWYKAIDLVAKGLVDAISTMSKAWIEASSWFDKDQEFWDRQARIMGVQARQIRGEITMAEREKQIAAIENEKSPAEERRQAALAAAENERKAWQGQLDQMAAEEKKRRDAARDAEIKRLDDNVKKSKEELAAAVAEADRMAKMAGWNKTGSWFGFENGGGVANTPAKLQAEANRALAGGTTAGTFNAAAIRSLVGGGMDIPRQQLQQLEQVNQGVKKLRQDVQDNGLWFT